jgi:small subunit ribosomal protein S17e
MGRIRTQFVKRLGKELVQKNKESFKDNFEENKIIVGQLLTEPSKKVKNVVAGYVTKLVAKKIE